jgi:phosphatidylserine decarboxylase
MLRKILLRRSPDFGLRGRITWIEKAADRVGINRWFLRRPPLSLDVPPGIIISPAQSKVETLMEIGPEGEVEDKRVLGQPRRFRIGDILKDQDLARKFEGGAAVKLYLAPWDLHFLLFPVSGKVVDYEYRPGYPLPLLFVKRGDVLNERLCVLIETDWGFPIAVVMIGSWMVNGIHHSFERGQYYQMGDDFGHFKVGSSVVLVFPCGKTKWIPRQGTKVDLGAPLARVLET